MPELSFKGKEFVFNHHLAVPHRQLVPDASKSVGDARLDGNLVLHGDNLHALKSLLPMYAGKVDCIFIDPPYNTGNEGWCYNDNVNSPMMQQWLSENPVGIEDGLRHDKWCAMMWPRLRLLHELLGEAGSIWITLDDNEVHHARMMLDEIFGEDNFIASIVWQKKQSPQNDATNFSEMHDYVIVYAKVAKKTKTDLNGWQRNLVALSEGQIARYANLDSDERGLWTDCDYTCNKTAEERPNLYYPITNPHTGKEVWPERTRVWAFEPEAHQKNIDENLIWWPAGRGKPRVKKFIDTTAEEVGAVPATWWPREMAGDNQESKRELNAIFNSHEHDFATPKPVRLIRRILEIATNENSIILDSFAGSGTTAHAVLAANAKDGGERKFILVECEEYADSLTAERVRRVIGGYSFKGTQREELLRKSLTFTDLKKADKLLHEIAGIENLETHRFSKIEKKVKDGELLVEGVTSVTERVEGLGGSFTYCTLGEAVDLERMLTGENLPGFDQLGALLFHMATSEALDPAAIVEREDGCGYLGESSAFHVWLIYKPDLGFLKSRDSALTLTKARELAASKPAGKRHLVFAPAKFVSQKVLDEEQVPVEFAPLPWALYRIERS